MHTNNKTYSLNNSSVRFRRYCRKAYAVFASLKINVTIGTLASYIADAEISKSQTTPFFLIKSDEEDFNDEKNASIENDNTIALMQCNNDFIIPVVSTPAAAACAYIKNIINIKEDYPYVGNPLFLCQILKHKNTL